MEMKTFDVYELQRNNGCNPVGKLGRGWHGTAVDLLKADIPAWDRIHFAMLTDVPVEALIRWALWCLEQAPEYILPSVILRWLDLAADEEFGVAERLAALVFARGPGWRSASPAQIWHLWGTREAAECVAGMVASMAYNRSSTVNRDARICTEGIQAAKLLAILEE
jgi:hypothetical protein